MVDSFPVLRAVVLDTTDARGTAEFYRQLLGYSYRTGDEPPAHGQADPKGRDWLVLVDATGQPRRRTALCLRRSRRPSALSFCGLTTRAG